MSDEESAKNCPRYCCITAFVISILFYLLAVALSWAFVRELPEGAHGSPFPGLGAIIVTLPIVGVGIGSCILCICVSTESSCGAAIGICGGVFSWAIAFVCAGLCSFAGGILLFIAAANPPPPDVFNPQGYSAFAAIAGILAVIASIAHCCGLCGFGMTKCDDKESTGQNANSEK